MSMSVLAWRRAVADLYRRVRDCERPEQGFDLWREGRLTKAELTRDPLAD